MATSLTGVGVVWAVVSLLSAGVASAAFYLPYWLHGTLPTFNNTTSGGDVYFGSFRRCNYPRLTPQGNLVLVTECGRYTTFSHVPSVSWQVTTVLVGGASALSLLVAFTAAMSCCVTDIINQSTARAAGLVQLAAGTCRISWSFYALCASVIALLVCVCMSLKASRVKSGSYRI